MRRNTGKMPTGLHVLALVLAMAGAAEAGPPLICHPFETGSSALLPWSAGEGWNTPDRTYDVEHLVADTTRLLGSEAPVLARMENLRRATIYASRDPRVAAELLAAVLGRALTSAAQDRREPLAWFDAGYLIESYRQASAAFKRDLLSGTRPGALATGRGLTLDGYPFVRKALEQAGASPEMEFAASLIQSGPRAAEHRRRAQAAAPAGSLLARNMAQ